MEKGDGGSLTPASRRLLGRRNSREAKDGSRPIATRPASTGTSGGATAADVDIAVVGDITANNLLLIDKSLGPIRTLALDSTHLRHYVLPGGAWFLAAMIQGALRSNVLLSKTLVTLAGRSDLSKPEHESMKTRLTANVDAKSAIDAGVKLDATKTGKVRVELGVVKAQLRVVSPRGPGYRPDYVHRAWRFDTATLLAKETELFDYSEYHRQFIGPNAAGRPRPYRLSKDVELSDVEVHSDNKFIADHLWDGNAQKIDLDSLGSLETRTLDVNGTACRLNYVNCCASFFGMQSNALPLPYTFAEIRKFSQPPQSRLTEEVFRTSKRIGANASNHYEESGSSLFGSCFPPPDWGKLKSTVLVVDDESLGSTMTDAWNGWVPSKSSDYVVVKSSRSLPDDARGFYAKLREQVSKGELSKDRVILVLGPEAMRQGKKRRPGFSSPRALSWDAVLQEIASDYPEGLAKILEVFGHVLVHFKEAGAVHITAGTRPLSLWACYDRALVEGEHADRTQYGDVFGVTSVFVAHTVRAIAALASNPSSSATVESALHAAVEESLHSAMRLYHFGFGGTDETVRRFCNLDLPIIQVFQGEGGSQTKHASETYSAMRVGQWSMLEELVGRNSSSWPLQIAEEIVRKGFKHAEKGHAWPYLSIDGGKLVSVDRGEIEGIRWVKRAIENYKQAAKAGIDKPVAVGVFGPPGAGKGYVFKSLVEELGGTGEWATAEMNLSQLNTAEQVGDRLQRVASNHAKGRMTLVLVDEFDCPRADDRLGWLRLFLAPLQDGGFDIGGFHGQIRRAVFVFAGGVYPTMEAFAEAAQHPEAAASKARDFVSRIGSYLNVVGPNPTAEEGGIVPTVLFRRAVQLRSMIQVNAPQILHADNAEMDDGILRAFLQVEGYIHGSRSMETILKTSRLQGQASFTRDLLPMPEQLRLHVTRDFMLLLRHL